MTLPVEVKKNLPSNFSKVKSKEALLKPLPIDTLINVIINGFKDNRLNKNDPVDTHDIESVLNKLRKFFFNKLHFGDWQYELTWVHNFSFTGELTIEIIAKKINTEIRLSLNKMFIDEYWLNDYEENPVIDRWENKVARVETAAKILYEFLNNTNKNIIQWDNLCKKNYMIINSEPPLNKVCKNFYNDFSEFTVREVWDLYKYDDDEYYNNLAHFIDEHEFYIYKVLENIDPSIYINFGNNPKYSLDIEIIELGSDYYYGYMLLEIYISIIETDVRFYILNKEFDKSSDFYTIDEVKQLFKSLEDDSYRAIIQWNNIIMEKGE